MKTVVAILTREQISKLYEAMNEFPDITQFDIVEENTSGIGPKMSIRFCHGSLPISIDITDVSNW